jgi:hypothetical protein
MSEGWVADPTVGFRGRLGKSPRELGVTQNKTGSPDIWELDNGDIAVIGTDLTDGYAGRLPDGVGVGLGERLIVIPRVTLLSAKPDIPDA